MTDTEPSTLDVLAKAVARAANALGMPDDYLPPDPVAFVRSYKLIDGLLGDQAAIWFHVSNPRLGSAPAKLAETSVGLRWICEYLEAMRGTA